jgi:SAM-dependent methyltransferase
MSLADEYLGQHAWRAWAAMLDRLPDVRGKTLLDLGCGVGDPAADLAARGAHVIGIDHDESLLRVALGRRIPNAEFVCSDLSSLTLDPALRVQGIWSSFTAAYFPALPRLLLRYLPHLEPGGFVALVEIDDLFGHEPLPAPTRATLDAFAVQSLTDTQYDFAMGRKLAAHMRAAGLRIVHLSGYEDQELAFAGQARDDVLEAWRRRLGRMRQLQAFCGERFATVRDDFIACLVSAEHRSTARVYLCVGTVD